MNQLSGAAAVANLRWIRNMPVQTMPSNRRVLPLSGTEVKESREVNLSKELLDGGLASSHPFTRQEYGKSAF